MTQHIRDNTKFGGLIYESDFNTEPNAPSKHMAQRIAQDWAFDETCRKNIIARERQRAFRQSNG